jgi:AraC-like DNA-binding protein
LIIFDGERPSDSPLVERIWHAHAERGGSFLSVAESRCELVVTRRRGTTTMTVRGPETRPTRLGAAPADGEWFGIRLKPGVSLRQLPAGMLVDDAVTLPCADDRSFILDGSSWQFPDFANADTFVRRLVRSGLLVREPVVEESLRGEVSGRTQRSVQRRFRQATGVTRSTARQIERARHATLLLRQGVSIPDTILRSGYFDQPHLTRSLRSFIGQTPAQIRCDQQQEQLSFLYKTSPFG